MSRGQMSLAVKCPAVKCHCGQMSQNLEVVKSPWSNVPWSNETVVIGDPIVSAYVCTYDVAKEGTYVDGLCCCQES